MDKELKNRPRPGRIYKHLKVIEHNDLENAIKSFRHLYNKNIKEKKAFIDKAMKGIYGRHIYFKECHTSDMVLSVHDLCKSTGCDNFSTSEIANAINAYLGRKVCFFRNAGESRIPVELERIKHAYIAVKENKPQQIIEEILYKE